MPGDRNAAYCRRRSRFNQTVESPPSVIGGDLTHGRDEEPRQLDRQGWGATGFSCDPCLLPGLTVRSEEHTSELQSLMRISYAVFCLKKKTQHKHKIPQQ